jgi:hypothetical protein
VRRRVFVIVYLRKKKQFGQNPEENMILTGSLTKTNRSNIIVKYNILK